MATDLSPYSCERVKLTARRSSFTVISNIIVYLFFWLVLHVSSESHKSSQFSPSDAGNFRLIVLTLVGLGLIFSALFHIFVREKPHNVQIKRETDDANSVDFSGELFFKKEI
jgi:Na+/melibiose symporter-like transporter